ncbi:Bacteriophage translational regulator [compost metagenome]
MLTQSAHILHRQGRYYICHFKELLALDGLRTDLSESDISRRNRIVQMLVEWGLVKVYEPELLVPMGSPNVVKVIKYADKDEWELRTKYTIGIRHKESV